MRERKKGRLNLYLSKDIIRFAKEWSYVTNKPISKMLEDHLSRQRDMVKSVTPFQWLNDPVINPELPEDDAHFKDLEEYIHNSEEEKFCAENPEHPRAKMRKTLMKEYEHYCHVRLEQQKENEKELIKRWMEVFQEK